MSYTDIGSYPQRIDAVVIWNPTTSTDLLYRGDVVQIEAETIANLDGANAQVPVVDSSSPETLNMMCGVVLGTAKKFTYRDQEEVPVRVLGVVEALVDGGTVDVDPQDHLYIQDALHGLIAKAAEPDLVTPAPAALAASVPTDLSTTITAVTEIMTDIDAMNLILQDLMDMKVCKAIAIDEDDDAVGTRSGAASTLSTVFFNGIAQF